MDNLIKKEESVINYKELIPLNILDNEFNLLMMLYQKALDNVLKRMLQLKDALNSYLEYDVISDIKSRMKTPESILNKMKKKEYDITYENLIENINDIAGVRIICTFKDDIYKIRDIISQMEDITILKEKDYLKKAKRSGYEAYHLIVEVPVKVENQTVVVKVEIQIKTLLMDFWSTTEHKVKYKTNRKISSIDSRKLSLYAKMVSFIETKMMKIYRKHNAFRI